LSIQNRRHQWGKVITLSIVSNVMTLTGVRDWASQKARMEHAISLKVFSIFGFSRNFAMYIGRGKVFAYE
jgi:hypothetical protein